MRTVPDADHSAHLIAYAYAVDQAFDLLERPALDGAEAQAMRLRTARTWLRDAQSAEWRLLMAKEIRQRAGAEQ